MKKIEIELTSTELGVLRRLILEESRKLGYPHPRPSDEPPKLKRMRSVARKIYEAQLEIKGRKQNGI